MGILETLTGGIGGNIFKVRNADRRADKAEEDYWGRLKRLDLDYSQAAETAPTFQMAESPVARAYLESFLTGSNADAVQGTRNGAEAQRSNAAQGFERDFGNWGSMVKSGRAERGDPSRFEVGLAVPGDEDAFNRSVRHDDLTTGRGEDARYNKLKRA